MDSNTSFYIAAISVGIIIISFLKWHFTFWKRHGVPSTTPYLIVGDAALLIKQKESFGQMIERIYKDAKAKKLRHVGAYVFTRPTYVPIDPEIIKHILQQDSGNFINRGFYYNERDDPLGANLFTMDGEKWKELRQKITPTFTTGQMKNMFQTLVDCAKTFEEYIESHRDLETFDIKDVLARFTTDIIGSCAFGIECNSLKDPDADFRKYGKLTFETDLLQGIRNVLMLGFPASILRLFRLKTFKTKVVDFFKNAVLEVVTYREKNNIYRKDFMHLLLQLKNRGMLSNDGQITADGPKGPTNITFNELAAQAFLFYLAGFETSSTTVTFAIFELAQNHDIQDRARKEIQTVLAKHGGRLTYEAVMEMQYLQRILDESLRKYPAIPMLDRQSQADYRIPNDGLILPKNTHVTIPVIGIHHDPEFYPSPEVFDPDRFTDENKNARQSCTYLPFGEGPRICIGLRFGLMQSKVALATILKSNKIYLDPKTKIPLEIHPQSIVTSSKEAIWIKMEKIRN